MATVCFLAESRPAAKLMMTYFEYFCSCKLREVWCAQTENNDFMISGDIDENLYHANAAIAMQSLSKITHHLYSFKMIDEKFKIYRITMK